MIESSVCFLLDESNIWIRPYTESFVRKLGLNIKKNIVFDPLKTSSFKLCFLLGYTKILKLDEVAFFEKEDNLQCLMRNGTFKYP